MKWKFCLGFLVVVTLVYLVSSKKLYSGYNLIQAVPTTSEQQKSLEQLQDGDLEVDFWTPILLNHGVDMAVAPEIVEKVVNKLKITNIKYEIMNKDLQRTIDNEEKELIKDNENTIIRKPSSKILCAIAGIHCDSPEDEMANKDNVDIIGRYVRHNNINRWLKMLPTMYPDIAEVEIIGKSYEGREIYIVKVGEDIKLQQSTKPIIFIEAGIHAREWLAPATAIYIVDMMLKGYKKNPEVTAMLNKYEWYILPLANPDGYEFTHTEDRLWRKTRSPQAYGCIGVDPNRNFDIDFGNKGSSKDPCHDSYPGAKPFSEPETSNIRDKIWSIKDRVKAYMGFHSYSQLILTPYGYTNERAPDHKQLMRVAKRSVKALKKVHGKVFRYGPSSTILYPASGTSGDWAKIKAGIKWAYAYELRPDVLYKPLMTGFILPKEEIKPSAEEVFASLVSIAKDIQDEESDKLRIG